MVVLVCLCHLYECIQGYLIFTKYLISQHVAVVLPNLQFPSQPKVPQLFMTKIQMVYTFHLSYNFTITH